MRIIFLAKRACRSDLDQLSMTFLLFAYLNKKYFKETTLEIIKYLYQIDLD